MEKNTMGLGLMGKWREKARFRIWMGTNILGVGAIIVLMVKVRTATVMVISTKEVGKKINLMEEELFCGNQAINTLVIGSMV